MRNCTRPPITTWQPRSLSGFRRTGFMSTVGSRPQASAWTAWARPISPPPGHTAALLDMFCDLNGATRIPARANSLQRPVTTTLLPTSEAVPIIIRLRAFAAVFIAFPNIYPDYQSIVWSELDSFLRANPVAVGMFHGAHFRDQVGKRHQFRMRGAARQDYVKSFTPRFQSRNHFFNRDEAVVDHVGNLVQNDEVEIVAAEPLTR